jgi:hypothetical protein
MAILWLFGIIAVLLVALFVLARHHLTPRHSDEPASPGAQTMAPLVIQMPLPR